MKIKLDAIEDLADRLIPKYVVVVSAITPTPLGEGKQAESSGRGGSARGG